MAEAFDHSSLRRWRRQPISFIGQVLYDPETKRPFVLLPAERAFLEHAFKTDDTGRLLYPEQLYACPKKSGKTTFAAIHSLVMTLLFGGSYPEAALVANDLEQARGRVFEMCKRIVECSSLLRNECNITLGKIEFPALKAVIFAIGSDYAGAAGGNQNISCFDELWAYSTERARRLFDELVPPPTKKIACRLTVTYAGFEGESTLLEELYKRGLKQPKVGEALHAGDGLLMAWHHQPVAPWQTEAWLAEMRRSLRPNQYLRMIENRFVTTESSFVNMAAWDRCVDPRLGPTPFSRGIPIYIGVDASVKHDQTAIVSTTFDKKAQHVRLVFHRVFQPTPDQPLDFEQTVEATLIDLHKRFFVRKILFDPYQLQSVAQRLLKRGLRIEEFPQSSPNLTTASQNLYELIESQRLIVYPDRDMRLAISRAVAVETPRGWRISKMTAGHKIDVVVALAMSCLASVQGQGQSVYNLAAFGDGPDEEPTDTANDRARAYRDQLLAMHGQPVALVREGAS